MVDGAALLDQRHDARQARVGEDDARSALGDIGRRADGDADFRLPQRGRVVHAVARHADDPARGLQALDDDVLVLGVHLGEAVGAL